MSTIYNGMDVLVARVAPAGISSTTNASPIELTTTAAHGFAENDVVEVVGHTTNYAANGRWRIHIISSTKFTLIGSGGVGVGGATGVATNLNLSPQVTLPNDLTDDADAASVNVALEVALDRTSWLAARLRDGNHLCAIDVVGVDAGSSGFATWSTKTAVNTGWTNNTDVSIDTVDVVDQDIVDIEFSSTIDTTGAGGAIQLALFSQLVNYGASSSFASATRVPGSGMVFPANLKTPFSLRAGVEVSYVAAYGKLLYLFVGALTTVAGPETYLLVGDHRQFAKTYRHN